MIKRVLLNFYEVNDVDAVCSFTKKIAEKFKIDICGMYVKDIRKYEVTAPSIEGIAVEVSNEYALKEWENSEKLIAKEIEEKFKQHFPDEVFLIEEGITSDTVLYRLRGYDMLITFKGDTIRSEIKNMIKSRYKAIVLVPKQEDYSFENILFADDDGENANKSFFYFMALFGETVNYNVLSVNIDMKDRGLEDYMELSGYRNCFYEKTGDEFNEIIKEIDKNDMIVMGNLRYFYMLEKIIGKTGVKLLENSKIPIFIA